MRSVFLRGYEFLPRSPQTHCRVRSNPMSARGVRSARPTEIASAAAAQASLRSAGHGDAPGLESRRVPA